MQEIVNKEWVNEERVKYFNLLEFISKIRLSDNVLHHMEETGLSFESYIKTLFKYCNEDDYSIILYLLDLTSKELKQSSLLENSGSHDVYQINEDLFFDKLSISHERIKDIHRFVCEKGDINVSDPGEYRKILVNVGAKYSGGYQAFWYAPEPSDVKAFMNDYISFYKHNSIASYYNNPFLKAALAHLLFVRIHPFEDGNGRTARIINNIALTSRVNRIYDVKLKVSPLNISQNIAMNKYTYVDILNRIRFSLDADNNAMLNRWFEFILNMYDEQLFYQTNKVTSLEAAFDQLQNLRSKSCDTDEFATLVRNAKLERLKKI